MAMTFLRTFWAYLLRRFKLDFTKAHYASLVNTDKVFVAQSASFSVPQYAGAPASTFIDYDPGHIVAGNIYGLLPFGIYSYDNGVSWNSFTTVARNITGVSVQVTASYYYPTDVARFQIRVVATVGSGTTIPVLVKFGFIQLPSPVEGATIVSSTGAPLYLQKTAFDSRTPVPRIATQFIVRGTGTGGGGATITIPHGQSSIPDVRVGATNSTTSETFGLTGPSSEEIGDTRVDATNIYLTGTFTQYTYFVTVYQDTAS